MVKISLITKTYTFSVGSTIIASEHNSNYDTIYNDYNGNIENVNIKAATGIAGSKINPAFTANVTIAGNLSLTSAGNELKIKEGANASMGTALLQGGTAVVSNTLISADTRVFLQNISLGGTAGVLYVSNVTSGTSFYIRSTISTDSSKVCYLLIEPA